MAFMLLCDKKNLRKENKKVRTAEITTSEVKSTIKPDKDGFVKGRDEQGNPIKAKIRGESLVRRLKREEEEKKRAGKQVCPDKK